MMIRCEYEAWLMQTDVLLSDELEDGRHLTKAIERFGILQKFTDVDGGVMMSDSDKRVWVGENGLAAWGALKLYERTENPIFLEQAKVWIQYITKNPPTVRKDQPRLQLVFVAWNNYALMKMAKIEPRWHDEVKQNTELLLYHQKKNKHWTICQHYDLYIARGLLYSYQFFKLTDNILANKCLLAVQEYLQKNSKLLNKTLPIHYWPLEWRGSGYSTLQHAQLNFEIYILTSSHDYLADGLESLEAAKKHLVKNGKVLKRKGDKETNELATDWLKNCEVLKTKCENKKLASY